MFARFVMLSASAGTLLRLSVLIAAVALCGCGSDDKKTDPPIDAAAGTCVDCHTDQASLIASADPDSSEVPENPGEG